MPALQGCGDLCELENGPDGHFRWSSIGGCHRGKRAYTPPPCPLQALHTARTACRTGEAAGSYESVRLCRRMIFLYFFHQEENAKLCDVFMRWLLGEAGVRFQRRREYEVSESRRVPNTESLADRLRCCLQVCQRLVTPK